jgi:hypothetical protein
LLHGRAASLKTGSHAAHYLSGEAQSAVYKSR